MTSRYEGLARAALAESTSPAFVGEWLEDRVHADGVVDVVYASAQDGYHGWSWIVSVAELPGEEPTVLELGLIPGEDALLAPEWIPWSVRLAEWEAQQAAAAAEAGESSEADEPDDDDDDESDDDDEGDESAPEDDEDSDDDDSDEDDDLDDDDDESDDDDDDDDDFDEDAPRATHGGDIDGVDIDDLDD